MMQARLILRSSTDVCLYTNQYLTFTEKSIEHVIPQRLLAPHQKGYIGNLAVVSRCINSFRRDYRFGSPDMMTHPEHLGGATRCRRHRIFYPLTGHRTIAEMILRTIDHYPDLWTYKNEIVADEQILRDWLHLSSKN